MAKGYWIGRVDVKNEEGYKPYAAANAAIFKKFGGRFVIRAGKFECPEGTARSRNVVIEFLDYAAALALQQAGCFAIVLEGVPLELARTITAVTVIAPATAPVIGGVLITVLSWHWIFLVNVPFGIFAFVFGLLFLPRAEVVYRDPFDTAGFVFALTAWSGVAAAASRAAASPRRRTACPG